MVSHGTIIPSFLFVRFGLVLPRVPVELLSEDKNVAVNQVGRACHLGAILMETLAREALGRQIRQSLGTC